MDTGLCLRIKPNFEIQINELSLSNNNRTWGKLFPKNKGREGGGRSSLLQFFETWLLMHFFVSEVQPKGIMLPWYNTTCSKKATILHYRGALGGVVIM